MRPVNAWKSSTYRCTDSRHRRLNASMPYSSIWGLPEKPSSFSTSTSTGSPWQSQPPFRATCRPRIVWKRGNRSLKRRAQTWWMPGRPFAVGGPS